MLNIIMNFLQNKTICIYEVRS